MKTALDVLLSALVLTCILVLLGAAYEGRRLLRTPPPSPAVEPQQPSATYRFELRLRGPLTKSNDRYRPFVCDRCEEVPRGAP